MALGIYASLYLLSKFKDRIPYAPRVDFVAFEDGLLIVRCSRPLTSKDTLVKIRASFGTLFAQVKVESYDERDDVFRLAVEDHELLIAQLPDERRDNLRLHRTIPVFSDSFDAELSTEDISENGLRLLTPEPLVPGTTLHLKFQLGDLELEVESEVCWSAEKIEGSYHCGISFLDLTESQLYNIRCYVEHHLDLEEALKQIDDFKKS